MNARYFVKTIHILVIFALLFPLKSAAAPGKELNNLQFPPERQPQAGDSYSISGKVTDSQGSGIGGVTVTARTASYPILLVHGYRGIGVPFGCTLAHRTLRTEGDVENYFGEVDDLLAPYFSVHHAHLVSNPCYTPPLETNVIYLLNDIRSVLQRTGAAKVILVAHSMGGLVSRAYIESDLYKDDVEALITFGSPHRGIPLDLISFFANVGSLGSYCKNLQPGLCDFSTLGMIRFNRNHPVRQPGVKYYTISGDAPLITRNALGLLTDRFFLGWSNDGIVSVESGLGLPNTGSVDVKRYSTDENHNVFSNEWAGFHWTYFDDRQTPFLPTTHSTSYTGCLQPILLENKDGCYTNLTSEVEAPAEGGSYNQRTALTAYEILPGETVTRTIIVENAPTLFGSSWITGTVEFSLRDPDGLLIDPGYAEDNPSVVTYTLGSSAALYEFASPKAGVWTMIMDGANLPAAGTRIQTFAAFESSLVLTGSSDRSWYKPGETVTITATLEGSQVESTELNAVVIFADETSLNLPLQLNGNQYQASLIAPAQPGYVDLRITASGTAGGQGFERGLQSAFQIAPQTIRLAGEFSEAPQPVSPGSSFYTSLEISAEVEAAAAGRYGLSGVLVDGLGRPVAQAAVIQELSAGPQALTLRFNGEEIFASERDGPYTLSNLLLSDLSASALPVEEAENVYTTAAYSNRQFGAGHSLYLPLAVRNSNSAQAQPLESQAALLSYTTITNSDGTYTLSGLPAGSYTITPSQEGSTFSPPSRTVIVPANAYNQDFTRYTITVKPPGSFTKLSPANGAVNRSINLILDWSDSSGATSYAYCYDTTNDNTCSNWVSTGTSSQATISGLAQNTTYYWQVMATNASGTSYANRSRAAHWRFTTGSGTIIPGEMVLIPAGEFQMGCNQVYNDGFECPSSEIPLHSIYLDAFSIDKYEVTNAQYLQCVTAGVCLAPAYSHSNTRSSYYDSPIYANYPVIYVSWFDANNYCQWAGKRLPSEAEWEKAARGPSDTRPYPWGFQSANCSYANYAYNGHCVGDTTPVGSYPIGASPFGVMDMEGNVAEWVNDWFDWHYYIVSPSNNPLGPSSGTVRVLRGGGWNSPPLYSRLTYRGVGYSGPSEHVNYFGFRCAAPPGP